MNKKTLGAVELARAEAFTQGIALAVASMIRIDGHDGNARFIWKECTMSIETCIASNVDELDMEVLKQYFKPTKK